MNSDPQTFHLFIVQRCMKIKYIESSIRCEFRIFRAKTGKLALLSGLKRGTNPKRYTIFPAALGTNKFIILKC